jgi:hypothetical protein
MKNNKVTLRESIERVMSMGDSNTRNNWVNSNPQAGGYDSNPQWRGREVSITDTSPANSTFGIIDRPSTEPFMRGADTRWDPNDPFWNTIGGQQMLNRLNEFNKKWNDVEWWRNFIGANTSNPYYKIQVLNLYLSRFLRPPGNVNGLDGQVGIPPMLLTLMQRAYQEAGLKW